MSKERPLIRPRRPSARSQKTHTMVPLPEASSETSRTPWQIGSERAKETEKNRGGGWHLDLLELPCRAAQKIGGAIPDAGVEKRKKGRGGANHIAPSGVNFTTTRGGRLTIDCLNGAEIRKEGETGSVLFSWGRTNHSRDSHSGSGRRGKGDASILRMSS